MNKYTKEELILLGFSEVGNNVSISKYVNFYNITGSIIGNNVRIDDFCILIGKIYLKNYIHIGPFCILHAADKCILIESYCSISSHVSFYASSDFLNENSLHGPHTSNSLSIRSDINIGKGVLIGTGCRILPGSDLEDFSSYGANIILTEKFKSEKGSIYISKDILPLKIKQINISNLLKLSED